MDKRGGFIAASVLMLLSACGESTEPMTIGEARQRAESVAAEVVASDSTSLMKLQDCILAAKAVQSEYMLLGDTAAADTFDAVFRRSVGQGNPRLANEMFNAHTAQGR